MWVLGEDRRNGSSEQVGQREEVSDAYHFSLYSSVVDQENTPLMRSLGSCSTIVLSECID